MKNLLFIILAALVLLLSSCAKFPNLTQEDWEEGNPYTFIINSTTYDTKVFVQDFLLVTTERCYAITLNGRVFDLFTFDKYGDYYYNYFEYSPMGDEPIANAGGQCLYNFIMGSKSYAGEIQIPTTMNITWPEYQDDQDYTFSWYNSVAPWNYMAYAHFGNYETGDEIFQDEQFEGDATTYTVPEATWSPLANVHLYYEKLTAINFQRYGSDGIAVATHSGERYLLGTKGEANTPLTTAQKQTELRKQTNALAAKILKGSIKFPE